MKWNYIEYQYEFLEGGQNPIFDNIGSKQFPKYFNSKNKQEALTQYVNYLNNYGLSFGYLAKKGKNDDEILIFKAPKCNKPVQKNYGIVFYDTEEKHRIIFK